MTRRESHIQLAQSVADQLFATERAVDDAMCSIAGLTQSLPAKAREAGFAATRGQAVYDRLVEAMAAQARARAAVVEAHNALADLQTESVFRSMPIGGGTKDEKPGTSGRLAVVAA